MNFTQDWFSHNIPNFQHIKQELRTVNTVLEIGAFEGRATCWMLDHMLSDTGHITVIDTFEGSAEHEGMQLGDLASRFEANVKEVKKPGQNMTVLRGTSYKGLARLIDENARFQFIYVDGSHSSPDVLTDACMAFGLLEPGGIMLFDDYMWMDMPSLLQRPKIAIDAFTTVFAERSVIRMAGYQLAIQKDFEVK